MYLAMENWAKKNGAFKMEAKFISNVDPDDAAAVLNSIDVEHSLFVLVSKSGTTLETLTNESFERMRWQRQDLIDYVQQIDYVTVEHYSSCGTKRPNILEDTTLFYSRY